MMDNTRQSSPVLERAWQHQAEFDANASQAQQRHINLRRWVIILSVVATLVAILTDLANQQLGPTAPLAQILQYALIATPLLGSAVLAFANKFQQGERWLALRAGAEEIKREIYFYRTLHQADSNREQWLHDRVAEIQREAYDAVDDDLVLAPYRGPLPPSYSPNDPTSDPGFNDLGPDQYLQYRLEDQLNWHANKAAGLQRGRIVLQILVIAFGGLGALLAAVGGLFSLWVAFTAALVAALNAWLELRQYDSLLKNYGQVMLELNIIHDRWQSLSPAEQTVAEFLRLVTATEGVLWSQHNLFVTKMRQAIAELQGKYEEEMREADEAEAIPRRTINLQAKQTVHQMLAAAAQPGEMTAVPVPGNGNQPEEPPSTSEVEQQMIGYPKPQHGAPHAFVVMPFGRKKGPDGNWIDFNAIYEQLIKPALLVAGFEPFRADEATISGDILTDMFQELLLADLVIADLSIDNANVFYELGVRHAMRKRGVVHIQSGRAYLPFDIFNVRTVPYTCSPDGRPDPAQRSKEIEIIAKIARDTWESDRERVHSPIFNLLNGLTEPDRASLRTPLARGYWREYYDWKERILIAKRRKYVGDILLLTEEIRNPLIKEEVIAGAGEALRSIGCDHLALEQYRRGLQINPGNLEFHRQEAFYLGRMKKLDEALVKLEWLLAEHPHDAEAMAFLGRVYKELFMAEWIQADDRRSRLRLAYEAAYLLKRAFDTYRQAYSLNQNDHYPGLNALAMALLLDHLDREAGDRNNSDPEIETVRQQIPALTGAVQFSLAEYTRRHPNDFWAFASLGDYAVLTAANPREVERAYRQALALGGKDTFKIRSTLEQLELFGMLAFRLDYIRTGSDLFKETLQRLEESGGFEAHIAAAKEWRVFLFSGHMIDAQGRAEPRFPPGMEAEARQRIEAALDKFNATGQDMAITAGAACGGDILFIEACLARGMRVEVYLPFTPEKFVETSVGFPKDQDSHWVERFHRIRLDPKVTIHLQPERLGPVPAGDDLFARNNRWALYSALGYDISQIRFIVLWNGQGGDGPGGAAQMVDEVRRFGGIVEHVDTTRFDYWQRERSGVS